MSEARSSSRMKNTDFSIARILADDRSKCMSSLRTLNPTNVACTVIYERDIQDVRKGQRLIMEKQHNFSDRREINEERVPRHQEEKCSIERYFNCTASRRTYQDTSVISAWNNDECAQKNNLTWLQYTRYRPPKLPKRSFVERRIKRRPGNHPRIPFSSTQLQILEDRYKKGAYLSRNDVIEMSTILRLPQSKVKIWFQNRRARHRRELLNSTIVTG